MAENVCSGQACCGKGTKWNAEEGKCLGITKEEMNRRLRQARRVAGRRARGRARQLRTAARRADERGADRAKVTRKIRERQRARVSGRKQEKKDEGKAKKGTGGRTLTAREALRRARRVAGRRARARARNLRSMAARVRARGGDLQAALARLRERMRQDVLNRFGAQGYAVGLSPEMVARLAAARREAGQAARARAQMRRTRRRYGG